MVGHGKGHIFFGFPTYLETFLDIPASASQVGTANRVFLFPFYVPLPCVVSKISMRLLVLSAANNLRLGLYQDKGRTPVGGSLLADSGNISTGTTGVKDFTFGTPIKIPAGWIWGALATSDAVQAYMRGSTSTIWNEVGSEVLQGAHYDLGAFGPLTDPCPAVTIDQLAEVMASLRVDNWSVSF